MYSWKNVVLKGFALFAMLFGAGNLIFPPMLGKTLADSWAIGTMGFILTGVGFPLLGILSTSLSGKKILRNLRIKSVLGLPNSFYCFDFGNRTFVSNSQNGSDCL